ncbi:rho guanine nucleotide exchange factor 7-like isoform X1 [Leucoraja erinacea]|uniref:rho guanine nucleotide exchange factor 7-like isoform X1 n=1 Tax=Leucoraja erinaceus TaxID=7782 RepID=UPI002457BAC4|nr:rho guanine nucleotide exchange factor 7-like isoform X1 [Leucoraja erinacea]
MSSAEQTVTWLISLGVLESPKKSVSDPEAFLRAVLRDGVALCRLLERLVPGSVQRIHQDPKSEVECLNNIKEFLKACGALRVETFDANDLYQGQNFNKILSSLVTLNKVTADIGVGSDSVCTRHQSHQIKSADSLAGAHLSLGRTSKNFPGKYRSLDMTDNSNHHMVVKAKFNFYQTNEDELCFAKGDIIHVTRIEEGGWWEGTLNGKNGWFPSNYVREMKLNEKTVSPKSATLKSSPKGFETPPISKGYYNVVLQNILDTECDYAEELTMLLSTFLRPLQASDKLSAVEVASLIGNLEDICSFQQTLVQCLEDCTRLPESQQKVGGCFANLMSQMKSLYLAYCANHPWAVNILTEYSEELGEFVEMKGASSPGILMLTTSLSKPFMRLDKYPTLLKELERHMEDSHPDWPDIQRSMTAFKSLSSQCQEIRKRKELELQILTETVHGWEGEDIRSLGNVIYMSQLMVQSGNEEKCERYFLLFPHVLLMLSASPRMSGFIYQGKLPLTGLTVTKLEDSDENKNAFEITGSMIERILVSCSSHQDMQEWVDHLHKQTKAPSVGVVRQQSMPCHTLPLHPVTPINKHSDGYPISVTPSYHTLPHPSLHGTSHSTLSWGPLEPPKMPKPWSLSCLRPAAPLKPSAALCYKEDLSRSPKTMKKLLPKRKPERKPSEEEFALRRSTAALEEDAQILKVIEAYCTSAKTRQTLNSTYRKESAPQVFLPEEEKMIVEETNSNGQMIIEEKTLVDTVYALKDEVLELKQESKKMWCSLEEEQRARKELEKLIRKVLKNRNDFSWDETNL